MKILKIKNIFQNLELSLSYKYVHGNKMTQNKPSISFRKQRR